MITVAHPSPATAGGLLIAGLVLLLCGLAWVILG
jgi:hypothetical protein